ncbi:MAG: hypothetical protein Q9M14_04825 [Mariprofundaceae bacterium]|nr:hypothetical protein [Mariprofundaceae bacterium]
MGQVTIYIDDKTEANMNAAVKASGISRSKWVACVIREKAGAEWPQEVKSLAGKWQDLPMAEDLRQTVADAQRESF